MENELLVQALLASKPIGFYSNDKLERIKEGINPPSLINELLTLSNYAQHNFYEVESLLQKCNRLINSLLERRDELKNLEVYMLNQCLSQTLRKKSYNSEIQLQQLQEENKELINALLTNNSILKFKDDTIQADEVSQHAVADFATKVTALKNTNRKDVDQIEATFEQFSENIDSGLNYLDRYLEKKDTYAFLLKELYKYLVCLAFGLNIIYDIKEPLPSVNNELLLNKFHTWFRQRIVDLEKITEYEHEVDIICDIKNGMHNINEYIPNSNHPNIVTQIAGGIIIYTVPNEVLKDKKNIRLRGVSVYLAVGTGDIQNNPQYLNEVFPVEIKFPSQLTPWGSALPGIPDLRLNATSYLKYNRDLQTSSTYFYNINPFRRPWTIRIAGRGNLLLSRSAISNVYLILKIAYTD